MSISDLFRYGSIKALFSMAFLGHGRVSKLCPYLRELNLSYLLAQGSESYRDATLFFGDLFTCFSNSLLSDDLLDL